MRMKNILRIICERCGCVTEIPIKYFYDGCEGPFFCSSCGELLDLDIG